MSESARDEAVVAGPFNRRIVDEFRANGGRVGGALAGTPMILVHHFGARSGIERVTPVACTPQDDGRYVIIGSNGGAPAHPHWVHNLRAHPRTTVEFGTETIPVLAEELAGAERAEVWAQQVARYPQVADFQARTARQIPLFMLTPRER